MKIFLVCLGSTCIGIITFICNYGWFKDGSFYPKGMMLNILLVTAWVLLLNFIEENKS